MTDSPSQSVIIKYKGAEVVLVNKVEENHCNTMYWHIKDGRWLSLEETRDIDNNGYNQ